LRHPGAVAAVRQIVDIAANETLAIGVVHELNAIAEILVSQPRRPMLLAHQDHS